MGYEEGEGDLQAQLDEARKRIQTQEVFLVDLRQRVNKWEDTFACQQVLMQLLNDMFEHYSQHNRTRGKVDDAVLLANRYYIQVNDPLTMQKGKVVSIPKAKERLIESLWLDRVEKGSITILGMQCEVRLHPDKVCDDKPLPIIIFPDHAATEVPIKRQSDDWRHSFMCKNAPGYPGRILDSQHVASWRGKGNFATCQDTILLPGSALLENIVALWTGRDAHDPPQATLLVDSKMVRLFVTKIAIHTRPRCHFVCIGSTKVYAYLVLTADDGMQSEIARLPVGTASF
tara:strand:+ start:2581 stop:3441 length:861 start_codon:yes stop_codon:yes gene_type:complete